MIETLTSLAYLLSAVLFIFALRSLSHPETARGGINFGIAGMMLAIVTTIAMPQVSSYQFIIPGIVIGGTIGALIANKIA